jgi:hypothetical protein
MNSRARWLICLLSALIALFLLWAGLASGQGPVLTVLPTPTPAGTLPSTSGAAPASGVVIQGPLPDLVVDKIQTYPAVPLVGQSTLISVTIKNQGAGDVPTGNNFFTDLYIDPPFNPVVNYHQIVSPTLGLPWSAQGSWLGHGQSYVFTTTWVFTDVKTVDIWALVDSNGENIYDTDGVVIEGSEYNNTRKVSVSILTTHSFTHTTHQDFMTNMASTLDNGDPGGGLALGLFEEPPLFDYPFSAGCAITTSSVVSSDYNMETPDARLNADATGRQVNPYLVADGNGVVIAVWEDGRDGDLDDRDIYLRYSTDEGETWGGEVRVNADSPHANQLNPVAALSEGGDLLVAWQDNRNGDYDIYAQRYSLSGGSLTPDGANVLIGGVHVAGDQINPDIAVDEDGGFHVVWQDGRNGNYDIFTTSYVPTGGDSYMWTNVRRVNDDPNLTQQSNPAINVLDWFRVTDVEYIIGPGPDYDVTVTEVVSEPVTVLAAIWEDYRQGNGDIAIALSLDGGETFSFDRFINDDADPDDPPNPLGPNQLDPDVTLTRNKTIATISVPLPDGRTTSVEVEVPVTSIYAVWQDYRNGALDPDIYYSVSQFGVKQVGNDFNPELTLGVNEKINSEDARSWQTSPVWQQDPALVAVPCGGDAKETEWNVFITWADGRNYDNANYDIYFTTRTTCPGIPEGLVENRMLNDGVHLYNYDASNSSYDEYSAGSPPPGRQVNPAIAADIETNWPYVFGGYIYLAWEDDRAGDPQVHKDISFARSNLTYFNQYRSGGFYGAGSQISNILDSGSDDTIWYTVDWSAATAVGTYLTVQTRLGDTITDVLASDWYPPRFPYQPQPDDCLTAYSGAPLPGYDAPGQHIEDSSGSFWPQARYIQYRVNFFTRVSENTPVLDNLTIYFEPDPDAPGPTPTVTPPSGPVSVFMPILLK